MSVYRIVILTSVVLLGASNAALAQRSDEEFLRDEMYDEPNTSVAPAVRTDRPPILRSGRASVVQQAPVPEQTTEPAEYSEDPVYRDRGY